MRSARFLLVATLLAVLSARAWSAEPLTWWSVSPVPAEGAVTDDVSLALLPNGEPAIAYFCDGNLKYSWREGGAWKISTVGKGGWYPSLAILPSGQPAVSHVPDNWSVKYAWFDGLTWNETSLADWSPAWTSLAILPSGYPAVAYKEQYNYDARYAWYDGTTWRTTIADGPGDQGSYCSLAVGLDGEPAISYQDRGGFDLRYAWRSGGSWHSTLVDSTGPTGARTSLVFLPDGSPAISYSDELGGPLRYAHRDGSTWTKTIVDPDGGGWSTLKVWRGCPAIAYQFGLSGIRFTWFENGTWHREVIDTVERRSAHLAILPNGQPVVLYQGQNQFHYAERRVIEHGDLNCDGAVNFKDINPFVLALSAWGTYQQIYPDCNLMLADMNADGFVTFKDINPFVALLAGV
jgi:hypothetical protein